MPRAQRSEFSKQTKLEAWTRAQGRCECGCGLKIIGTPEYHHIIPASIGGSNSLENCAVYDPKCHRRQTSETDVPQITRSKRIEEKRLGLRVKRGPAMSGSRRSKWRKRMNGTVERRDGS